MYPDPDRPRRFGAVDLIVLSALVAAAAYLASRVGDVLVYNWDWAFLPRMLVRADEGGGWRANLLLQGLFSTIRISVMAMLLATVLGVALGLLASARGLFLRGLPFAYVALIRNVPPLVFVFVFYFFVSDFLLAPLGLRAGLEALPDALRPLAEAALGPASLVNNTVSGVLCLAFLEAAYIAEIMRAGVGAVPGQQREAARALGLSGWRSFRLVVLPQAVALSLPALANQFIILVKNSAIISLISVQELTFLATEVAVSTGRRFETWIAVAAMYFVLCYGLARLFRWRERRTRARRA